MAGDKTGDKLRALTALFSVVYAVLLKPLPYAESDQLFNVFEARPQDGIAGTGWSYANFAELREQNRIFSEMAGSQKHQLTLTGRGFAPSCLACLPRWRWSWPLPGFSA
jgi:hypothetical protein